MTTNGAVLQVEDLTVEVDGKQIVNGLTLSVPAGEVHAIMGPNGSGKSTLANALMGHPKYDITGGRVLLKGEDITDLMPNERARKGLFLAMQYPTEVPGVSLEDAMREALTGGREALAGGREALTGSPDELGASKRIDGDVRAALVAEAERIGFDERFLDRPLNVDLSGGEKKRNETVQLGVLRPAIAVLDELDSGLDVDALRAVSRRIEALTDEGLGVLAITHYRRLLTELRPDHVHVLAGGRIAASGGPELAEELEQTGYAGYAEPAAPGAATAASADPFADPFAL